MAIANADLGRLLGLAVGSSVQPVLASDDVAVPQELGPLVALSQQSRPDRTALAARVARADAAVRAAHAARRPSLALAGGIDLSRPNRRILPPEDRFDDSWDVGLRFSWRIADGGRRRAEAIAAEARAEALEHALEALDEAITQELAVRLQEVATAAAALPVAERRAVAARESVRITTERYRQGLVPSSERLDAELRLLQAELEAEQAVVERRLAALRLRRAAGLPLLAPSEPTR